MSSINESIIMNGMDVDYMKRGLEITANIGRIMQGNLEDLQNSIKRMKQPAPIISECRTLQDFLEASYHDENYHYDIRYRQCEVNGYRISADNMLEIDNRLEQLHNRTEKLQFKVKGIENFIQSKM